MKTFFAAILAMLLVALTTLAASGLRAPWSSMNFALPFLLLITVIGDRHLAVRFAGFVGLLTALVFPANGALIMLVYLCTSLAIGPLFKLLFSIPTPGALFATAIAGSVLFELLLNITKIPLFYNVGFPAFGEWAASVGARFLCTALILVFCGEIYRRVFLRLRQAFVGIRRSV